MSETSSHRSHCNDPDIGVVISLDDPIGQERDAVVDIAGKHITVRFTRGIGRSIEVGSNISHRMVDEYMIDQPPATPMEALAIALNEALANTRRDS